MLRARVMLLAMFSAAIAGCGGGSGSSESGPASGGNGSGSSQNNGNGTATALTNSTCTDNTAGATRQNTCHELERIGGLALTTVRLNSLSYSTAYDRAFNITPAPGTQSCPQSGGVSAVVEAVDVIRLTFTACDFGLGPFSGTVRAEDTSSGDGTSSNLEIDVTFGSTRYQVGGLVIGLGNSGPQVGLSGSFTVGAADRQLMDTTSAFNPNPDGTLSGFVLSQHGLRGPGYLGLINDGASAGVKVLPDERGGGFVIVQMPFTGFLRYTRRFTANLRQEDVEAGLAVDGRGFSGSIVDQNTNAGETIASDWDEVMAHPRYDFSD